MLRLPYELEYRQSADFSYVNAKRRLVDLNITFSSERFAFITPQENEACEIQDVEEDHIYAPRQGRLLEVASAIDIESRLSVGCAGAVIAYISRRNAIHQLPSEAVSDPMYRISNMRMFPVKNMM